MTTAALRVLVGAYFKMLGAWVASLLVHHFPGGGKLAIPYKLLLHLSMNIVYIKLGG